MAVTFIAAGTFASGAAGITPGLPAGVQAPTVNGTRDLLILIVQSATGQIPTTPTGWNAFTNTFNSITAESVTFFWRYFAAGVTAPAVADTGDHQAARIFGFRGQFNPNAANETGFTNTPDKAGMSAVTATGFFGLNSCPPNLGMMVCAWATDTATGQASFAVGSSQPVDSITQQSNDSTISGDGGGFGVATAPVDWTASPLKKCCTVGVNGASLGLAGWIGMTFVETVSAPFANINPLMPLYLR